MIPAMRPGPISFLFIGVFLLCACATSRVVAIGDIVGVVFDADQKEESPKPGATNASFTYAFTNTSATNVTINVVRASCGCTTLDLPPLPWTVGPGQSGKIGANIDLRGKSGVLMKSISIESSAGVKHVIMKVNLPGQDPVLAQMNDRLRNQQLSLVDRQIVFRGDCARCHAEPAKGKSGQELFANVCAVCHDTPQRATMVPDLYALNKPIDANYWRTWISFGREGSLMPAFVDSRGGPLSAAQIESLVVFLSQKPFARPPALPAHAVVQPAKSLPTQ
jgi:cytochrome c553